MRKAQKEQAQEFVQLLAQAHDEIRKAVESQRYRTALDLLGQCQEGAIKLGELIETTEGEGAVTVPLLEDYCELVYQIYQEITENRVDGGNRIYKLLRKSLVAIENSVRNEIPIRLEVVFLPYKASMWDSLESVWRAAQQDEHCDAYVIPIPYYDRKPDGTLDVLHYEGGQFPADVPILHYDGYDFEKRRPDIVYIHNPYDDCNLVTSVDPRFYSFELKKYTDMLVYIPYYATTGGMGGGQYSCSAYYYADYVVMQAERYRKFFDVNLPQEKLLPLGSPKFDRVVRACANPPEPPIAWRAKLEGKRVYFYNTTIGGLLGDTEGFLKKMKYVFECFMGREDVCLLWRPHPLLESTIESMRPGYLPVYTALKNYFVQHELGIYDTTPDVTQAVALSDVYIGDVSSSVASLFGVAGKPIVVLNNNLHSEPQEDDWKGQILRGSLMYHRDYMITQGNKLYYAPNHDYQYRFCCDLSEYTGYGYYGAVIHIGEKDYVCPYSARDIVVIENGQIEKRVLLQRRTDNPGSFHAAVACGRYLFLLPNQYPALVCYDTESGEVRYMEQNLDVFVSTKGSYRLGGFCAQGRYLFLASPVDNRILVVDAETGEQQILTTGASMTAGFFGLQSDGREIWGIPYRMEDPIVRWNPFTGEMREYRNYPDSLKCYNLFNGFQGEEQLFQSVAFCGEDVYLSPRWANIYVRLNRNTGEMTEWKPPLDILQKKKNGYYYYFCKSYFARLTESYDGVRYLLHSLLDNRLYDVNLKTGEVQEIFFGFDERELREHTDGFRENSEWTQYVCEENCFNTLPDLLDGGIIEKTFDKEKQLRMYHEIAANCDGSCGEKIHEWICGKV